MEVDIMYKYRVIFAICFLFLIFVSCNSRSQRTDDNKLTTNDTSSIKFFVDPKIQFPTLDSQEAYYDKRLNLDAIRTGFDSLQIRIWFFYAAKDPIEDTGKVLIIKKTKSIWSGEIFKLRYFQSNDSLFQIATVINKNVYPQFGWNRLIDKIFKLQLFNQSSSKIAEESVYDHPPTTISVQVATAGNYYQFEHFIPSAYKKIYWQIEDLKKLLQLLDLELGFYL
jgi:hypothetical protein